MLTKCLAPCELRMPLIDVENMYMRILQMYSFFEGINEIARNNLEEKAAYYSEYKQTTRNERK